jgi:D-alanyl-D-alanine dipeptidase
MMELINIDELKATNKVKKIIAELQERLLVTEDALEDIARSAEIAEISGQFEMMSTFVEQANKVLVNRTVRPDSSIKSSEHNYTIVTNESESNKNVT